MARSELIREGIGYLPTFFTGGRYTENPDEATLLIRRFRLTRGPTGKLHGHSKTDGVTFSDPSEMVRWIEHDAFELPAEADGISVTCRLSSIRRGPRSKHR